MLVSKNAKICVTPNANAKICVTPNATRWSIGLVGSTTGGAGVLFVLFLVALGIQRKRDIQWNTGFIFHLFTLIFHFPSKKKMVWGSIDYKKRFIASRNLDNRKEGKIIRMYELTLLTFAWSGVILSISFSEFTSSVTV